MCRRTVNPAQVLSGDSLLLLSSLASPHLPLPFILRCPILFFSPSSSLSSQSKSSAPFLSSSTSRLTFLQPHLLFRLPPHRRNPCPQCFTASLPTVHNTILTSPAAQFSTVFRASCITIVLCNSLFNVIFSKIPRLVAGEVLPRTGAVLSVFVLLPPLILQTRSSIKPQALGQTHTHNTHTHTHTHNVSHHHPSSL